MKVNIRQIEKIRNGLLKAIEDKKSFVQHFAKGGNVEDFKPEVKRTVVRPV